MSRTTRKKYVSLYKATDSYEAECVEHAKAVIATGRDPQSLKWYGTDYKLKIGLGAMRFDKNINRDGTKAHGDTSMMINISRSKLKQWGSVRTKMRHELKNMRAGNIDWDANLLRDTHIRAKDRAFRMYDLF